MRPSDENQHRSKRPNLFSSSRRSGAADDNILAKLERGAAPSAAASPGARARYALFGTAGMVIAGLIGLLAWITHENVTRPHVLPAAVAHTEAAPDDPPKLAAPAVIVDAPPAPRLEAQAPPLVTLASARLPVTAPASAPAPAYHSYRATQASRPLPRPVVARADAAQRVKPAVTAAHKPRPVARAEAAPVDTDVAILTAILTTAARHAPEGPAQDGCEGARAKKCD